MPMDAGPSCPICRRLSSSIWIPEYRTFFVTCPRCTTFTIASDAARFFRDLKDTDRHLRHRLSWYLRTASDDADREVTLLSWPTFAAAAY